MTVKLNYKEDDTDENIKALNADYEKALERADHLEADRIAKMQRFRKFEYM